MGSDGGGLSDDDKVDDEQVGKEQVVEGGEFKRLKVQKLGEFSK